LREENLYRINIGRMTNDSGIRSKNPKKENIHTKKKKQEFNGIWCNNKIQSCSPEKHNGKKTRQY
jgi:hypothetical protein